MPNKARAFTWNHAKHSQNKAWVSSSFILLFLQGKKIAASRRYLSPNCFAASRRFLPLKNVFAASRRFVSQKIRRFAAFFYSRNTWWIVVPFDAVARSRREFRCCYTFARFSWKNNLLNRNRTHLRNSKKLIFKRSFQNLFIEKNTNSHWALICEGLLYLTDCDRTMILWLMMGP